MIIAASIIRNEEKTIQLMLESLSWVDQIVIYNDHCNDFTLDLIRDYCCMYNKRKVVVVDPLLPFTMFSYTKAQKRDISKEIIIRNKFIDYLFDTYCFDALVLIDGDELMSKFLKKEINNFIKLKHKPSGIALSCYHLFTKKKYLNVYPAKWNNQRLIDPHIRVLFDKRHYCVGLYPGVPDCFLKPNSTTYCCSEPYHFHLKYFKKLNFQNHSLRFLPKKISEINASAYLRDIPKKCPMDIKQIIKMI